MRNLRTDLAVEAICPTAGLPEGVSRTEKQLGNISVTHVRVLSEEAGRTLGKPVGSYYTLEIGDFRSPVQHLTEDACHVGQLLRQLLPPVRLALVVGLGNRDITPDALGPKAVDHLFVTRHIEPALAQSLGLPRLCGVAAMTPGVLGQTGIESAEQVSALVQALSPDCVIAVDALAAASIDRLATTLQLSDTGIAPGSGVQNSRAALQKETLGVPVIAVGVPLVVDLSNVTDSASEQTRHMMVTPREIDQTVEHAAKLIGYAISLALQPDLSPDDLAALIG